MTSSARRGSEARTITVFRGLQTIKNGSISGPRIEAHLVSSPSRLRTGQHDAKTPLMHRQHRNPTALWSRMHPKTLSLIVRLNPSVPTGPARTDCRTRAAESTWRPGRATGFDNMGFRLDACNLAGMRESAHPGRLQCRRSSMCQYVPKSRLGAPLKLSGEKPTSGKKEGTRKQGLR